MDALDQGGAGLRRRWGDGQQRGEDGEEETESGDSASQGDSFESLHVPTDFLPAS